MSGSSDSSGEMPIWALRIFRFGPLFIIPVMVAASYVYAPWRHYDSLPGRMIVWGLPLTVAWHLSLIILDRPKILYVAYALLNLALYLVSGFYCLFWVTGDSI
jgi:hypothetical protein